MQGQLASNILLNHIQFFFIFDRIYNFVDFSHFTVTVKGHGNLLSHLADNSEFSQFQQFSEFPHSCAEQLGLFSHGHCEKSHMQTSSQSESAQPGIGASGQEGVIHLFELRGSTVNSEVSLVIPFAADTYRWQDLSSQVPSNLPDKLKQCHEILFRVNSFPSSSHRAVIE